MYDVSHHVPNSLRLFADDDLSSNDDPPSLMMPLPTTPPFWAGAAHKPRSVRISPVALGVILMVWLGGWGPTMASGQPHAAVSPSPPETATVPRPLPPLARVMAAALEHAPALAAQEAVVARNRHEVDQARGRWMEGLTAGADASYGSYGNRAVDALQLGQRVTVGIRVSLFDLLGRRATVGAVEHRLHAARHRRDAVADRLRRDVIDRYYVARRARALTAVQSRAHVSTATHLHRAETAFRNGTASIDEVSRVTEVAAQAEARFVEARLDYEQAYRHLEALVGVPLDTLAPDTTAASAESLDAPTARQPEAGLRP